MCVPRDFLLKKTCISGSYFFGNVNFSKEVKNHTRIWQILVSKVCGNLADGKNWFAQEEVNVIVQKWRMVNNIIEVDFVCLLQFSNWKCWPFGQFNNFLCSWFPWFSQASSWDLGKPRYVLFELQNSIFEGVTRVQERVSSTSVL